MLLAIYPWIKALHVISVIVWMGAQLALFLILAMPRDAFPDTTQAAILASVQNKLIRCMLNPGIVVAFICGGTMLLMNYAMTSSLSAWLMVKLALAIVLSAMHGLLLRECRLRVAGSSRPGLLAGNLAQWVNLALLAAVVALAIIKPTLQL